MLPGFLSPPTPSSSSSTSSGSGGADDLADRLERALADEVKLLALTLDERRSCSPRSRIRRRSSPSCARFCSPTISGADAKGSTERRSAPLGRRAGHLGLDRAERRSSRTSPRGARPHLIDTPSRPRKLRDARLTGCVVYLPVRGAPTRLNRPTVEFGLPLPSGGPGTNRRWRWPQLRQASQQMDFSPLHFVQPDADNPSVNRTEVLAVGLLCLIIIVALVISALLIRD